MKKEWEKITEGGDSVAMWQSTDDQFRIELYEHSWLLTKLADGGRTVIEEWSTGRLLNNSDEDMTPQMAFESITGNVDLTDFLLS